MTATIEAPASTISPTDVTTEDVTTTPGDASTVQVLTFSGSVSLAASPGLAYGDLVTFLATGRVSGRGVRDFYPAGTARISTDVDVTELVTLDGVDVVREIPATSATASAPVAESRALRTWYGFRCAIGGAAAMYALGVVLTVLGHLGH